MSKKVPIDEFITNIAILCLSRRLRHKISLRTAATQIGISYSGYHRIERGKIPSGKTMNRVLKWLYEKQHMPMVTLPGARSQRIETSGSPKMERLLKTLASAEPEL